MEWRVDEAGQRYRGVEEPVLLSWCRRKMQASPVYFYRVRAKAIERGETPLRKLPEFVAQAEHAELMRAMENETPRCNGLEVFARDRFADPEEVEMTRGSAGSARHGKCAGRSRSRGSLLRGCGWG